MCDVCSLILLRPSCFSKFTLSIPSIAIVVQRFRGRTNAGPHVLRRQNWPVYFVRLVRSSTGTTCAGGRANKLPPRRRHSSLRHQQGTLRSIKVLTSTFAHNYFFGPDRLGLVDKKFQSAWKYPGTALPTIKSVYKIIENKSFLQPYDAYKLVTSFDTTTHFYLCDLLGKPTATKKYFDTMGPQKSVHSVSVAIRPFVTSPVVPSVQFCGRPSRSALQVPQERK